MPNAEKLFDVLAVIRTDLERSVVIRADNKLYKIECKQTGMIILDESLWILEGDQLQWIYDIWPETMKNKYEYSMWMPVFFSQLIEYAHASDIVLPISDINMDVIIERLRTGVRFCQLIKNITE